MPLRRPLSESVVVVTGASGGIGAATSLALAARGATVVLAARRADALHEVVRRAGDARTLVVPTDVADPAAVSALADRTTEEFGRVDAWVNNAGVGLYAGLAGAPLDEVRRVIDVNLLGYLYGVRAALPGLRAAGGGVIVNVASVLSEVTVPFMGAYNLTKHAVRGLSDTLRQELARDGVSVCGVLPASIDTPFYRNAGNRSGREVRPMPPVYPPRTVARAIVRVIDRPRRQVYAGPLGHALAVQMRLTPAPVERVLAWYGRRAALTATPAAPTSGNLFAPGGWPAEVDGGFHGRARTLARTAAGLSAAAALALVAAQKLRGRT
ncbi:SDR family oxidoreductase [Virgisporangium ochraceum]|uniref:Short-chain dehydrogenase n=1 Tax=Virgisporangium ochraceum TaxID=65505 RepID=A0A8J4EGP5_9ACTN|nr:SDR family oxidoreductase [Virgisporangium ochraceum]GIJ73946.1 short-chain dehydrogenase [Virgisporangium ochraceum]